MSRMVPLVLAALLCVTAVTPALAYGEENRTVNRATTGEVFMPQKFFILPEHYEFLPYTSNHDPQHQHPTQWEGQDWDPSAWNPDKWTPEVALKRFYENRVFAKQYISRGKPQMAVLEVGPTFFKISDLDRRRSLKLLADYTQVFESGYDMIELRDWYTHDVVGSYTRQGMHLN